MTTSAKYIFLLLIFFSPLLRRGLGAEAFAQQPPKIIFLKHKPAPQTITIPLTQAQAQGKKWNYHWRADTISRTKEISLAPPETIFLPVLKNKKGEIKKDKDGNPFILGEGGISNFQTYTTDNGLALDAIGCSQIDKSGNLWFGTNGGGVSRYDGKSFTNYTTAQGLANNNVFSITEDKSGNLWFGTDGGVSRYDGKFFTNYTTAQGLANNNVFSITEDKSGNLWFGTNGGVSRYNGKSFTNYTTAQGLANNMVRSITEDKSGNFWFGTYGGGVSRYDGKSFTNYTTAQGLANNYVLSSTEDKSGNFWFGTNGGGVSRYDGKSFTNYTTAQGLANNMVRSITEDKSGNLWFGTNGGGVSRYDGKSFTNYTTAQGLANNIVRSITEDKNGNLWFGTFGGGVSRYDGKSFTNYTRAQGLANNTVWSITEDISGNLWFGTGGGGVSRYDGKSFTNYTTAQGLANNAVVSITEDKSGNLWFGTDGGGVSRYDGKSFTNYTTAQGLANNYVSSITEDKSGNLWFGTNGGGVSRYDGKSFTNYTRAQGLANNNVVSITEDKSGNLWFGTYGGVSRYDGKSFTNYTTAQGLESNAVLSSTEDKSGNLWFGTYGGVSRYDGKSFTNYTTNDGLPDDVVTQVVEAPINPPVGGKQKEGDCLVIGTNMGIAILTGWKDKNGNALPFETPLTSGGAGAGLYSPVFEIYNSSTGFPVKDVNSGQNAMYKDSKGIIWIATGSDKTGLVRFDPSAINKNPNPPTVILQKIKINEENICWYNLGSNENDSTIKAQQEIMTYGKLLSAQMRDSITKKFSDIKFDGITKFYPLPEHLVLPYQHNHITFEFCAIEPAKPYLIKYQYILEGYDNEWSPLSYKTDVSYGNIYEGTYTFKLKAQSPFGVWSEPIEYKFTVLPPWWRTWYMYTLYALLAIAIIILIVWWNGKRLRARAKELEQEIKKATHTIAEKQKEIIDSITYANRIQRAILPHRKDIWAAFPESFVLFKPKDIVSGDFYFFHKNEQSAFIATADCTGHGVPGAFMSMIGAGKLNDAVSESSDTSEILSLLNKGIKSALKQTDDDKSTRDGMDIALCSVNTENRSVKYAGANRPLWIIRNGQTEVEEIKATKTAIGGLTEDSQHFDTHVLKLQQGDTFYISTDGYADQFGGHSGKKLMTKKFKEILLEIQSKTMKEQEQHLNNFIENWKAGTEQVDDILIIGIRL